MKIASIASVLILVAWLIMTLLLMWTDSIPFDTYIKVSITMLLVALGVVGSALVIREYVGEKKMKKDNFID